VSASPHPLRDALPIFLLAGLCLSSLDATAKYLVRDHPLLLVVWARYAGQMLVVTPFAWHRAGHGFWRTKHPWQQLLRSALLLAATIGFFGGLRYLPLAEGVVDHLHGADDRRRAVVADAGRATDARAHGRVHRRLLRHRAARAPRARRCCTPAVLLLLMTALCNALYQLYTRKLRDENPHALLFYSALVGAAGLTLALPFLLEATAIGWRDSGLLLLSGVFAGLGHGFMITAYSRAPAAMLAPFTYLQIGWATLFGLVLFDQHPRCVVGRGHGRHRCKRRVPRAVGAARRAADLTQRHGPMHALHSRSPQATRQLHRRTTMNARILATVTALALTLCACDRQSAATRDATEKARESAAKAGEVLKDAAKATGAAAKDAAKATVEAAKDASQQASEAAKQAADKATPRSRTRCQKRADATKQAADKAAAATKEAADKTAAAAKEAADKAKEKTK
jgi:drug/metabolite transporter (DMT)-like permease